MMAKPRCGGACGRVRILAWRQSSASTTLPFTTDQGRWRGQLLGATSVDLAERRQFGQHEPTRGDRDLLPLKISAKTNPPLEIDKADQEDSCVFASHVADVDSRLRPIAGPRMTTEEKDRAQSDF